MGETEGNDGQLGRCTPAGWLVKRESGRRLPQSKVLRTRFNDRALWLEQE